MEYRLYVRFVRFLTSISRLFKNLGDVYTTNLTRCKDKKAGNIDDANRILRPYLIKKKRSKKGKRKGEGRGKESGGSAGSGSASNG